MKFVEFTRQYVCPYSRREVRDVMCTYRLSADDAAKIYQDTAKAHGDDIDLDEALIGFLYSYHAKVVE